MLAPTPEASVERSSLPDTGARDAPSRAFWQGRSTVIAGGTGFLGGALAERLEGLGARVHALSRAGGGVDFLDLNAAEAAFQLASPGVVFHCAALQGGVAFQRREPAAIVRENALLQMNVLEAAHRVGAEHFVNVVPACAYPGEPPGDGGLYHEEDLEAGPLHPSAEGYGVTKRLGIVAARQYAEQFGLAVTLPLLANTYGPRDHFGERSHIVAALLRRVYEAHRDGRDEVIVWGRGLAERDLLYVSDAIDGILLLTEQAVPGEGARVTNVGRGVGVSVREVAETISMVIGYRGRFTFDPSRPEGPLRKVLDTSRLRSALDWRPATSLAEGVRRTLAWLREHEEVLIDGA
jgi:GDP-L-fucose synthase